MSYIRTSGGPGDIAALPPTFGLSLPPTIGASSAMRNIAGNAPQAGPIPSFLGACAGCMGQDEQEEEGLMDTVRPYLLPAALGAAAYLVWQKMK